MITIPESCSRAATIWVGTGLWTDKIRTGGNPCRSTGPDNLSTFPPVRTLKDPHPGIAAVVTRTRPDTVPVHTRDTGAGRGSARPPREQLPFRLSQMAVLRTRQDPQHSTSRPMRGFQTHAHQAAASNLRWRPPFAPIEPIQAEHK
jgi:hypothetical protein